MDIHVVKKQFRQQVLAERRALTADQRAQFSRQICDKLQQFIDESIVNRNQSMTILTYMAMADEVDLRLFHEWCFANGHSLLLPRVLDEKQGTLTLHAYQRVTKFQKNRYGIDEPLSETVATTDWQMVDVALVPGVAYDRSGRRLGFGGGFYDRLLPQLVATKIIAPAFTLQVVQAVPAESHDASVDWLMTEKYLVNCMENR
jgi:5-formyltetrahydrofolate cyclo-ligase